ncbi:MAG: hypothetical protein RMM51_01630 [Verrucomicrobiae bacterium]|nr:hypothetical protein [Verrucomicrobiae bacterium]
MELFDCAVGQRVRYKENGQPATIKQLWRAQGQIELEFANGQRLRVAPRLVEPLDDAVGVRKPKRPCPQCGADMGDAARCPTCGFEYRQAKTKRAPVWLWVLVILIVIGAVVAWKFLGAR